MWQGPIIRCCLVDIFHGKHFLFLFSILFSGYPFLVRFLNISTIVCGTTRWMIGSMLQMDTHEHNYTKTHTRAVYLHTCAHTNTCAHAHIHACTTDTHMHMHTHAHAHAYIHVCMHIQYMHKIKDMYIIYELYIVWTIEIWRKISTNNLKYIGAIPASLTLHLTIFLTFKTP